MPQLNDERQAADIHPSIHLAAAAGAAAAGAAASAALCFAWHPPPGVPVHVLSSAN